MSTHSEQFVIPRNDMKIREEHCRMLADRLDIKVTERPTSPDSPIGQLFALNPHLTDVEMRFSNGDTRLFTRMKEQE